MIKRKILLGTMSAMLTTTMLNAKAGDCAGGVCFVNLDKHKSSKAFENKNQNLVALETPRYIEDDKTITIVLDGETITVFPHSSYVMTEEEKLHYSENEVIGQNEIFNEEANKDLLLVTGVLEKVEDKILEKIELPTSEYFCEKDRKPIYNDESGLFQCV